MAEVGPIDRDAAMAYGVALLTPRRPPSATTNSRERERRHPADMTDWGIYFRRPDLRGDSNVVVRENTLGATAAVATSCCKTSTRRLNSTPTPTQINPLRLSSCQRSVRAAPFVAVTVAWMAPKSVIQASPAAPTTAPPTAGFGAARCSPVATTSCARSASSGG